MYYYMLFSLIEDPRMSRFDGDAVFINARYINVSSIEGPRRPTSCGVLMKTQCVIEISSATEQ